MSGHISGVAVRMQQLEPTVIFVHCFAHCTNLCLQTLGRQSQCVHDALEVVMGISQLIRYSPKRSSLFDALRSQVSPGAPSLKPLRPTRWTVRTRAIGALLTNYRLLLDALEIIQEGRDEYAMKANGYLTSMQQFSTFFWTQAFTSHFFQPLNSFPSLCRGRIPQYRKGFRQVL